MVQVTRRYQIFKGKLFIENSSHIVLELKPIAHASQSTAWNTEYLNTNNKDEGCRYLRNRVISNAQKH